MRLSMSSAALIPLLKRYVSNIAVQTFASIRLANLERLIEEAGSLEKAAAAADTSSVYLSQLRNRAIDRKTSRPRDMGSAMARRLELAFGKPPGWMDTPQLGEPVAPWGASPLPSVIQPVTNLPAVPWGTNVHKDLPSMFSVAIPDDSMAPRVRRGDVVRFQSGLQPTPGDGILVVDDMGTWYFRLYRERRADAWEAHALHPDYRPMIAAEDRLQLVAVLVGIEQQRWGATAS
jgi:phage repressor protein C with HTH and peptisase S24 domain